MPDFSNLLPPEELLDETLQDTDSEVDQELELEAEPEADGAEEGEARSEANAAPDADAEEADPAPVGDGKTIPAELKELIQAHPDRAKLLKDLYFTNARYQKFGKVADVQKIKDLVDAYGSFEDAQRTRERLDEIGDLDALLEKHQSSSKLDEQYSAGDPAYVDHLAKSNPDAFAKIAPSFLQRFGNDHPEQYNYLMSQVVMSTLVNNGTLNGLSLLQQAAATGNVEQVKQVVDQLMGSIGALQQLSAKAPQVRQSADPRVAQLEQEKTKLQQERQQIFMDDLKGQAASWSGTEIGKVLKTYGKVSDGLSKRLDAATRDEIASMLSQNNSYKSKMNAAISRGDRETAIRVYKQFATPLVATAARKVAGEFGLKSQPKRQTNGQFQPTQQSTQRPQNATSKPEERGLERVTKYPSPKEVRQDIDNYYELAAKDIFYLKDGRKIKVVN